MRTLPEQLTDELERGDSIALLCPAFTTAEPTACADLLTLRDPAETAVLSITFTQSPADRVGVWENSVGTLPAEATILAVDPTGDTGYQSDSLTDDKPWLSVDIVSETDDLTTLWVRITDWLDKQSDSSNTPAVCFRSITSLLQYVDHDRAYTFLDQFTTRCREAGATTHSHINPSAHDEQTIHSLSMLFDAVCEYEGTWKFHVQ